MRHHRSSPAPTGMSIGQELGRQRTTSKSLRDAAEKWLAENDPEGVAFEYEVVVNRIGPHRYFATLLITPAFCWTPHAGR